MSHQRFSQVVVVLASFDEQVSLYVRLHLLHRGDKVVVPPVNLQKNKLDFFKFQSNSHLILAARSSGVGNTGTKSFWKLSHKVVVDSVLHRTQNYNRPGTKS